MSYSFKCKIRNNIVFNLYELPVAQLIEAASKLLVKIAIEQGHKLHNIPYYLVYNGKNYFSMPCEHTWQATPIVMVELYEAEFRRLDNMLKDLSNERAIISGHFQQILNNSQNVSDMLYLCSEHVHPYLPAQPDVMEKPSALALAHEAYLKTKHPERESTLNQRVLTNVLIKNL